MTCELWHPEIEVTENIAKQCIEEQFAELTPLQELVCVGEGWDNKVFLVNREIIFRFPRRNIAVGLIDRENRVLKYLHADSNLRTMPSLHTLQIPNPEYFGKPSSIFPYPFHGYKKIPGKSGCYAELTAAQRAASIVPLAKFIKQLHSINVASAEEIGALDPVLDRTTNEYINTTLIERTKQVNNTHIMQLDAECIQHEIDLVAGIKLADHPKCLIQGDLYCRHLMFNNGKLTGIIDWGDVAINNPAVDLAVVHSFYPKECHAIFLQHYGAVDPDVWKFARVLGLCSLAAIMLYADDVDDKILLDEAKISMQRMLENKVC